MIQVSSRNAGQGDGLHGILLVCISLSMVGFCMLYWNRMAFRYGDKFCFFLLGFGDTDDSKHMESAAAFSKKEKRVNAIDSRKES